MKALLYILYVLIVRGGRGMTTIVHLPEGHTLPPKEKAT